jgi:U3 small nucleolar RNA-associated protein 7
MCEPAFTKAVLASRQLCTVERHPEPITTFFKLKTEAVRLSATMPSGSGEPQLPKLKRRFKPSESYERGRGITRRDLKSVSDLKLKGKLRVSEKKVREAVEAAERTELLLTTEPGYLQPEGPLERTYHFRQDQIAKAVDEQSARKAFALQLDTLGPYRATYSRDGQHLLLGGRKGHLALIEWQRSKILAEVQLRETIRDVCFLHSHAMYAVAQKKDLFIYDSSGIELHALRSHRPCVHRLGFLPYHFLLATVGETGHLRYLDVSTGKQVAEHATKLGACSVMAVNPANAIVHLGHGAGVVTLWSPNLPTPHVRMLCHTAPLSGLAVDTAGRYMTTAALDGRIKIWDLRTYREVHTYHSVRPAHSLDISATGVLAVGHGPHVEMWRDAFVTKQSAPYMSHLIPGSAVATVCFCPHEDVLGVGHAKGFSSVLVPGAGEAAFDAFEANPYANKKQRCAQLGALMRRTVLRAPCRPPPSRRRPTPSPSPRACAALACPSACARAPFPASALALAGGRRRSPRSSRSCRRTRSRSTRRRSARSIARPTSGWARPRRPGKRPRPSAKRTASSARRRAAAPSRPSASPKSRPT